MPRRTHRQLADPLAETEGVIELLKAGALTLDGDGKLSLADSGVTAGKIDYGGDLTNDNGTLTVTAPELPNKTAGVTESTQTGYQQPNYLGGTNVTDGEQTTDGDTGTSGYGDVLRYEPAAPVCDGCRINPGGFDDSCDVEDKFGNVLASGVSLPSYTWTEVSFGTTVDEVVLRQTDGTLTIAEVETHDIAPPNHEHNI